MKLKTPPEPPKPSFPPPPPVTLAEFRAAWVAMMTTGQRLDDCAASLLEAETPERRRAYTQIVHDGWHEVWALIQSARGLSKEDRATVESKVGPLFTEQGALTDVWRRLWVDGEHTQAWIAKCRREMAV